MATLHQRATADEIDNVDMLRTFVGLGIFGSVVFFIAAICSEKFITGYLVLTGLALVSSSIRFRKLTTKTKQLESRNALFIDFMRSSGS